jgi:transcriptional regulator with XRE-family HTH domain
MTDRQVALADPEVRRTYEEELLFGEATDTVDALIESLKISQRELARRLGVSEGRVSQVLSGGENLTLRSLAALGWAVGVRFELRPVPMANRAGTPAESDPPAPAWLGALEKQPAVEFRTLRLPPVGKLAMRKPDLRLVDSVLQVA